MKKIIYSFLFLLCISIPSQLLSQSGNSLHFNFALNGNTSNWVESVTQASEINVTSLQNTQFTINWTNGDGSARAVFVKQANTGAALPVDNTTYAANTSFGLGSQIDATGWYCVYNGTGSSVTVINLSAGETYRVMVTEYNGSIGSEVYNTSTSTRNPISIYSIASHSAVTPSIGNGTIGSPYEISSLENLYWIASSSDNWGYYYVQTQNIDASSTSAWSYGGWTPIGNNSLEFSGSYNGNGHSVTGLFINRDQPQQGLFGYTVGASISNVILLSVNITNSGLERFTGGLVGAAYSSTITNCSSSGSMTGNSYVGILVGDNNSGSVISNCFGTGAVSTSGFFSGGFVGRCLNATITNSYSMTNITRTFGNNAGIAAFIGNINGSTVTKCYSTGSFSFTSGSAATNRGFVGGDGGSNTFQNNFFDLGTSGQLTGTGATGKTTLEMKTISTFTNDGWDFSGETINGTNDYWQIDGVNNSGYPYLSWQFTPLTQASNINFGNVLNYQFDVNWTNGNGTARAVFVKQTNAIENAAPEDGTTYTANTSFGSGSQIGATGWYCVYNGTGSNVTVTNLLAGTDYRVMVTEYNGAAGSEAYNTNAATNNPLNQQTTNFPPPTVVTLNATNLGLTIATLNGEVNPQGAATDAYFEWGTDNTLTTFSTTSSQSVGSGITPVALSANLTGLVHGNVYYFRTVAINQNNDTSKGSISFFLIGLSQWEPFQTHFIHSLFDISFVDGEPTIGFAVGEQGTILKTTNFGTTWQPVLSVPGKWFNSVYMFSSTVAYAVGTYGMIYKTIDGGSTWIDQSISGNDKHFRSVHVVSATEAYAVGYAGTFYSTIDGGATPWVQNTQIPWTMHSIAMSPDFSISGKGIIAATDGRLYRRQSNGTWVFVNIQQTLGVYDYLNSVVWLNNSNAIIVGNNGRILKTTSSGGSWTIKTSLTGNHLRDVEMITFGFGGFVVIAVGDAGTIIRSEGTIGTVGNDWTVELSNTTKNLYGVSLPSVSFGFTIGEVGMGDELTGPASFVNHNLMVSTTSVNPVSMNVIPQEYELLQNFPNPFNPTTTIRFGIPESSNIKLNIYDMTGRLIQQLVNENLSAGYYEYSFDAGKYSSGTYFYRLEGKDFVVTKKMLLIK